MPFAETPSAQAFDRYSVVNPNWSEIVRQPLYDYLLYPTAGQAQFSFFSLPIGQGITSALGAVVGTPKSISDTNMAAAGMLPSGLRQMVEGVEVHVLPGAVSTANTYTQAALLSFAAVAAATVGSPWFNDFNALMMSGRLEFSVLSKTFLVDTPLYKFPPRNQLIVDAAIASNSATTAEVIAGKAGLSGAAYDLAPPIALEPTVSFSVTINYPAAVATPSGFNARIGVVLPGYQQRVGQ